MRPKPLLFLAALAVALPVSADAQTEQALASARADLEAAQAELAEVRATEADERPELARAFAETEAELREKRRQVRLARMAEADRRALLAETENTHARFRQDAGYLSGLLKEFALKVETVARPGQPALDLDSATLNGGEPDSAETLEARLAVVASALDRLEAMIGGSRSDGRAVTEDGEVLSGTFAAVGPAAWFQEEGGDFAGPVLVAPASALPVVRSERPKEVRQLLAGEEVTLPVDLAGGNARALADIGSDHLDLFRKGGFWIWPIIGLALVSTVCGILKFLQLMRVREPSIAWVPEILAALRRGQRDEAAAIASRGNHPASEVLEASVAHADAGPEIVEELLYERLIGVQARVQTLLPFIAITAATAPLLGLLGTVSGMIRTFNLITLFGSGDPKPLAGGISEALITTLFGLIVAIPALILHALLTRRAQGIVQTTEKLGLSFVNGLRGGQAVTPEPKEAA